MPYWISRLSGKRLILSLSVAAAAGGLFADRWWGGLAFWHAVSQRNREEARALELGRSFLDSGQPPRALRAVSMIKDKSPHEAEALAIRGRALAELGEIGPARQTLERAWKLRPGPEVAKVLAAIYLAAAENERGLQMLLGASRLDPADFRPWYAMGESVYLRLGRIELAIDAFRKALERRPGHVESRIGLIDALVKSHNPDEAEPLLREVISARPNDPRVLALAAEVGMELGREEEATSQLERALTIDPDHHDALVLHARLRYRRGQRREALAEAEHACRLDPNNLAALALLGSVQSSLGMKEASAATQARRSAVERRKELMDQAGREILERPRDPLPRCRLARLATEAGLKPLAIQTYVAALSQAPDCQPAREGLIALGFPPSRLPPPSSSQGNAAALPTIADNPSRTPP